MPVISGNHQLCREVSNALGLPEYVRATRIDMRVNEPVTIYAEIYGTDEQMTEVTKVLRKYNLNAIEEGETHET